MVKNPPANGGDARDMGSVPGLGRYPGVGNDNPLQYFSLENSMDRGAWQALRRVGQDTTEATQHAWVFVVACGIAI